MCIRDRYMGQGIKDCIKSYVDKNFEDLDRMSHERINNLVTYVNELSNCLDLQLSAVGTSLHQLGLSSLHEMAFSLLLENMALTSYTRERTYLQKWEEDQKRCQEYFLSNVCSESRSKIDETLATNLCEEIRKIITSEIEARTEKIFDVELMKFKEDQLDRAKFLDIMDQFMGKASYNQWEQELLYTLIKEPSSYIELEFEKIWKQFINTKKEIILKPYQEASSSLYSFVTTLQQVHQALISNEKIAFDDEFFILEGFKNGKSWRDATPEELKKAQNKKPFAGFKWLYLHLSGKSLTQVEVDNVCFNVISKTRYLLSYHLMTKFQP
eukprot:TRINITY_DN453_c0_g3_i1.p1 TRINITY_DN453_c0_g3~~TRINITY_DN453_c0_g3_i1.p1  ORF type:complete len:326 (+),score=42.32 TRINITY_DN453_c0_g3_i1:79-1056(+)